MPVCIRGEGIPGEPFYGCGDQMTCGPDDDGLLFNLVAHLPDGSIDVLRARCASARATNPSQQQVTQAAVLRAFQRIPAARRPRW